MIPSFRRNRSKSTASTEPCPLEASKIELLSAMDIFQDLSEEEVESLMNSAPMSAAKKGANFYGADGGPEVLFLLKEGKVELYRLSPEGKKLTLAIVEKGEFFGEMALVGQRLVDTYAVALEDSVICALSRPDVESLILEHPHVALRIVEALARRLQDARDALNEMAF
ncbi:MAG: Crp/Fnr family transcriptional regulator, partial [Chloroflexi bacterium]|nr:Crp/Fnr family transcriptional regulator [Chloroflexota bacterium]